MYVCISYFEVDQKSSYAKLFGLLGDTYKPKDIRDSVQAVHNAPSGHVLADPEYRGEVCVVLFNHGKQGFEVHPGDRIAQLILEVIKTPEVKEVDSLDGTARGAGGFGSTG